MFPRVSRGNPGETPVFPGETPVRLRASPLHLAAKEGHSAVVDLLLEQRADAQRAENGVLFVVIPGTLW